MKLDIVTLEVIRNVLPAIANEMSWVLQRTSHNMMIYEVRDYCCGLLDTKGRLLSQNTGGVSHFVADLGVVIRDGVDRYGEGGFQPGDVVITNHQRVGGQHLNNIMVYTPCFEGGQLVRIRRDPRPLDGCRRPQHRFWRRKRPGSLDGRLATRSDQALRGG